MNKSQLLELDEKLLKEVDPQYRAFLVQEVPKGEYLLPLVMKRPGMDPDKSAVIRNLSRLVLTLNRQLARVCLALGYQLKQENWPDSQPLEVLDLIYSNGLVHTEWYQRHLAAMLQQPEPNHPWYQLETLI